MENLLTKIKNIILGTYYNLFNKNSTLYASRICKCALCADKLYINRLGFVCKKCGCVLNSKTRVLSEHCPADKW